MVRKPYSYMEESFIGEAMSVFRAQTHWFHEGRCALMKCEGYVRLQRESSKTGKSMCAWQ